MFSCLVVFADIELKHVERAGTKMGNAGFAAAMSASLGGLFHIGCELIDKEHGRYKINKCHSLDYFEKHHDLKLLKQACEGLCISYNQRSADWLDSKIR